MYMQQQEQKRQQEQQLKRQQQQQRQQQREQEQKIREQQRQQQQNENVEQGNGNLDNNGDVEMGLANDKNCAPNDGMSEYARKKAIRERNIADRQREQTLHNIQGYS